jgi:hypothetical protein
MSERLLRTATSILVVLLVAANTTCGQETTKPKIPERLSQILDWLPTDTETLVVANGPFEIPLEVTYAAPFRVSAQSLACGLLYLVQNGLLQEKLRGQKVLTAVEASRRFTSPNGLGMMPYEGCQMLKFDESAHDAVKTAFESCFARAIRTIQLGGTKVAFFKEQHEEDEWSYFVAQPEPGLLLCATNERFLEEVLTRITAEEHSDRAFPDDLPEWEHVNVAASVWGIRHYRKEFAATDPSSPIGGLSAGNVPDPKAIGFVFWLDEKNEWIAEARYLSSNEYASTIAKRGWHLPSYNLTPVVKESKPGVIQITAAIPNSTSGDMFLFVLLGYLGHGVWL